MKKGEVWIVELLLTSEHEQVGTRPAIVLADTRSPVVVVAPLTANLQALRFPFTLLVSPSRLNGLNTDSVALVLHLRAIDRKRLKNKIGLIEKSTLKEIDKVLRRLLMI
ncbi:MAG: type II toxin-antitoxin system PemK/MazF family toxin [Patescibacteria group bacterium]